jgi:hypothetical protein
MTPRKHLINRHTFATVFGQPYKKHTHEPDNAAYTTNTAHRHPTPPKHKYAYRQYQGNDPASSTRSTHLDYQPQTPPLTQSPPPQDSQAKRKGEETTSTSNWPKDGTHLRRTPQSSPGQASRHPDWHIQTPQLALRALRDPTDTPMYTISGTPSPPPPPPPGTLGRTPHLAFRQAHSRTPQRTRTR